MTGPDFSRGFLRVPMPVWEALVCRAPLTRRQLQLAAVVLRESWGWQARGGGVRLWTRPLTTADFARATGLATDRIARDLATLERRGLLLRHGHCWQLVPAGLGLTERQPRERRPRPAGTAGAGVKRAPAPSDVQTGEKSSRNDANVVVVPLPGPHWAAAASVPRRSGDRAELFVRLVEAVAELSPPARRRLVEWVAREGVAAVWAALAPGFPDAAWLQQRLERSAGQDWLPDSSTPPRE